MYNYYYYFFGSMLPKFYQHLLALAFAVNKINQDPMILSNLTLGFHIYDSHFDSRMTYRITLDLLFKSQAFLPNYKCDPHRRHIALIGGISPDVSSYVADILSLYKIPQVRSVHINRAALSFQYSTWFCFSESESRILKRMEVKCRNEESFQRMEEMQANSRT